MIVSLYAGGMTVRDIQHHLAATLGSELSHETISNVTEAVCEEVAAWQSRPLEAFYPVIYLDALVVKIGDGAHVANRAAHIAVGVDMDGIKQVLGIWIQAFRVLKFWASVCSRAWLWVRDVLIVCCDGLTGFPEAVEATWSKATVQTCVVHLIRASMRFVSYTDRKAVAAMLKPIYTAPDEDAALLALTTFADSNLGKKYPLAVASWDKRLGAVHAVPGVRAGAAQGHLHHQQRRVTELPAPQDHQEPGPLPLRRGRDQAALAGHHEHRGQTRPRTRQAGRPCQGSTPATPHRASSKAASSRAGKPPSASSRLSTPTGSPRTCNPGMRTSMLPFPGHLPVPALAETAPPAAGVQAGRRPPEGSGLDAGEDGATLHRPGPHERHSHQPTTQCDPDHLHRQLDKSAATLAELHSTGPLNRLAGFLEALWRTRSRTAHVARGSVAHGAGSTPRRRSTGCLRRAGDTPAG